MHTTTPESQAHTAGGLIDLTDPAPAAAPRRSTCFAALRPGLHRQTTNRRPRHARPPEEPQP
jgi:hypothetical protein